MVFECFYHTTKKGRDRRLQEWEGNLENEVAELRGLVPFLRNLTRLRRVLEERRRERSAMLADALFEDVRF